jgi:hypothetical protein
VRRRAAPQTAGPRDWCTVGPGGGWPRDWRTAGPGGGGWPGEVAGRGSRGGRAGPAESEMSGRLAPLRAGPAGRSAGSPGKPVPGRDSGHGRGTGSPGGHPSRMEDAATVPGAASRSRPGAPWWTESARSPCCATRGISVLAGRVIYFGYLSGSGT